MSCSCQSSTSFVRFILKYFILFDAIVSGIIFLIYFLDFKSNLYLFMAVLSLCCCADFSVVVASRFLIAVAPLVAEHRL